MITDTEQLHTLQTAYALPDMCEHDNNAYK